MSEIKITELNPTGIELFQDSESFLQELSEDEIGIVKGGNLTVNLSDLTIDLSKITVDLSELQNIINARGANSLNSLQLPMEGNTAIGRTVNARTAGNFNTVN